VEEHGISRDAITFAEDDDIVADHLAARDPLRLTVTDH